jgi:hypothetical protein
MVEMSKSTAIACKRMHIVSIGEYVEGLQTLGGMIMPVGSGW